LRSADLDTLTLILSAPSFQVKELLSRLQLLVTASNI
jgi:hypothetical protein